MYQSLRTMEIIFLLSFVTCSLAIPREEFYSFGQNSGDTALPPNDDGSSEQITLLFGSFSYFEKQYTNLFVNTNGIISFDAAVLAYTPQSFPLSGLFLIAPYWADVDTSGTGTVYYRETRDNDVLRRARDDVMTAFSRRFLPIFVFIATWDRVGHFARNSDRIATFQCVLMTDGTSSFVKFLYADGEIQWTTGDLSGGMNGFGGTPAQVGFNAGDGKRFFSVPGSQTNGIMNIDSTTNVNIPGVWTFQVNGDIARCSDPEDMENTPLVINPRVGNMLGGTAVSITSACLKESDSITCQYEEFDTVDANVGLVDLDDNLTVVAVCVSPAFLQPGSKTLRVIVTNMNGTLKYDIGTRFYAVHIEDSTEVHHNLSTLVIQPQTGILVTWNPFDLLPFHVEDLSFYKVNIVLVQFDLNTGDWEDLEILSSDLPNVGEANVVIPILDTNNDTAVRPVAIQVRIGEISGGVKRRKRLIILARFLLWSLPLYYIRGSINFRINCEVWCHFQPTDIGERLLDELPPCPPRVTQARLFNSGFIEDSGASRFLSRNVFHKGSETCFRSREASPSGAGQQCCYDKSGNLLVGAPGGTVDKVSPLNVWGHFREDVIPAFLCCFGMFSNCDAYYQKRPSDNGERFNPPNPACVYGDPHIVTLDGFKYTFNGKGEYLIAQVDDVFSFQGRMTQAVNPQGNPVGASVFSVIAMSDGSNIIQFQVGFSGDPDALINGTFIDFTEVSLQQFNGVAVEKDGNKLSARFNSGAYIEIREENSFFSTLLVTFPSLWKGRTQGLIGNYNGNTADDLTPRTGNPLSLDADLKTIHEMFGVTWIIDRPQDSLFTYPEGESWANYTFPNFEPTFEALFSDPSLEQAADELCGDDSFCRFDIGTTENTMVGLSTLNGGQEFEYIVNNSRPTVCDPPCLNGACIATNTCSCSISYTGVRCDTSLAMDCDISPCENNGSCSLLAGSYICTCPFNYNGVNCQNPVGTFVNDTAIGDPLMTVPLNIVDKTSFFEASINNNIGPNDIINLCYELHGRRDAFVNLVSDECISVNAHYELVQPSEPREDINIIDNIYVRATDNVGTCKNIQVAMNEGSVCTASVDGADIPNMYQANGISIRRYTNRVRIMAPNCENVNLVMWVFCRESTFWSTFRTDNNGAELTFQADMIKFVIARGFNLREGSHGIIGQFWNIPILVEPFTGSTRSTASTDNLYEVTIQHPNERRQFTAWLYPLTWEYQRKYCLYAGNQQAGSVYEVLSPNDPVIEGTYEDYIVDEAYDTDFAFGQFDETKCNSVVNG